MTDGSDQRGELRLPLTVPVFVELPERDEASTDAPPLLLCRLVDFSANGVRIRLDRPLPEGAILRLSARLPGHQVPLTLVGEVRWVRPEGQAFLVGFSLYEADQTDILQWKSLVAGTF
ncbi:MAG: PilZ domain-containing protein [Alcanivoracaceae bacterium]